MKGEENTMEATMLFKGLDVRARLRRFLENHMEQKKDNGTGTRGCMAVSYTGLFSDAGLLRNLV